MLSPIATPADVYPSPDSLIESVVDDLELLATYLDAEHDPETADRFINRMRQRLMAAREILDRTEH